ncbi:MAG: hypothetical protein IPM16_16925 [Chloroflexi bacterium]|nr:hypothetical protein [Chloroflexota bacterium]
MITVIGVLMGTAGAAQTLVDGPPTCEMRAWSGTIDGLPDPPYTKRFRTGDGFALLGVVRDAETCEPIVDAAVMFDMTNADGEYDGVHRGTVYTNAFGLFAVLSGRPGAYGGGAPHIHLFVGADGYTPITAGHNLLTDNDTGHVELVLHRSSPHCEQCSTEEAGEN